MAKLLKNLYDKNYINLLTDYISLHYSDFDALHFKDSVFDSSWRDKELKQRMRHISTTLYNFLPKDYDRAVAILKDAFMEFEPKYYLENMIFQDFVEVYGLLDFEISIDALSCFTINSSSEFAIRAFILNYPEKTLKEMKRWAYSENEHIRRLSCEGCRPRLPWAVALPRFKENPQEIVEILEILKDDESKYVQKSVANNLNDISKDNPQILKEVAKRWIGATKNRDWILKHGCRTLLKSGDKEILKLFGYLQNTEITLKDFKLTKEVEMGEKLEFSFSLSSLKPLAKLRVEYAITFFRQKHKNSTKLFMLSQGDYSTQTKQFAKSYSFKPISTRKYYIGKHKLQIIVNGMLLKESDFYLHSSRSHLQHFE